MCTSTLQLCTTDKLREKNKQTWMLFSLLLFTVCMKVGSTEQKSDRKHCKYFNISLHKDCAEMYKSAKLHISSTNGQNQPTPWCVSVFSIVSSMIHQKHTLSVTEWTFQEYIIMKVRICETCILCCEWTEFRPNLSNGNEINIVTHTHTHTHTLTHTHTHTHTQQQQEKYWKTDRILHRKHVHNI